MLAIAPGISTRSLLSRRLAAGSPASATPATEHGGNGEKSKQLRLHGEFSYLGPMGESATPVGPGASSAAAVFNSASAAACAAFASLSVRRASITSRWAKLALLESEAHLGQAPLGRRHGLGREARDPRLGRRERSVRRDETSQYLLTCRAGARGSLDGPGLRRGDFRLVAVVEGERDAHAEAHDTVALRVLAGSVPRVRCRSDVRPRLRRSAPARRPALLGRSPRARCGPSILSSKRVEGRDDVSGNEVGRRHGRPRETCGADGGFERASRRPIAWPRPTEAGLRPGQLDCST